MTLLTKGTLYVARLTDEVSGAGSEYDGDGAWIKLTTETTSFVPGMSVADVLINTRMAADLMSPTRMDRPEDVEPNLVSGKIYAALTNNTDRGVKYPVDEANPISVNRHGYVLEMTERGGDHTGTSFKWELLLVCGDPDDPATYFGGFPKDQVSPISCPDNVAFDRQGNLWISTDGNALGSPRRPLPRAPPGPCPRSRAAVPLGSGRRRDLRPADQRRPADRLHRGPAPGREVRGDLRDARQHLAPHGRVPASVRGGRLPPLTLHSAAVRRAREDTLLAGPFCLPPDRE